MSPSKFNPLIYSNNLQDAGLPEEQANVHAMALADVLDHQVATKSDLEAFEARMDLRFLRAEENMALTEANFFAEMAKSREELHGQTAHIELKFENKFAELEEHFGEFKNDVIKWFAILSVSQIGITSAIVGLFVHAR